MANYFPQEIIQEILTRLPVKSLVRFRCVSKSWSSLVSNPGFVKLHLNQARIEDHHHSENLIISFLNFREFIYGTPYYYVDHNPSPACLEDDYDPIKVARLKFPIKGKRPSRIVGSCDGLLCFDIGRGNMVLWNPSTREYHELVPCPLNYPCHNWPSLVYGFGYDPSTDDYKVIIGDSRFFRFRTSPSVDIKIYSLKSNSWRRIGCFHYRVMNAQSAIGTIFKGAIHWPVLKTSSLRSSVIVALNLEEEKLMEMQLPYCLYQPDADFFHVYPLRILGGNLSVVLFWVLCEGCDVWVMKEYGVSASWTKLRIFRRLYNLEPRYNPIDVMWSYNRGLIRYNPKNPKERTDARRDELYPNLLDASLTYEETLLSPNPEMHVI